MKSLKHEQGFTLIEVLAALTISTIILGACFAAFWSLNQISTNATQQFTDHTQTRRAVDMLSRHIKDTPIDNKRVCCNNNFYNELRLNTMQNGYVAFRVEQAGDQVVLNMYSFNGDLDNPGVYTLIQQIADNLTQPTEAVFQEEAAGLDKVVVALPFISTRIGAQGQEIERTELLEVTIGLNKY